MEKNRNGWHYTEERVADIIKERMKLIQYYYDKKEPADDAAADVGYHAG